MIFFKIVFIDFIFLILSWLRITITIKLNHVGKHCNFPYKIRGLIYLGFHVKVRLGLTAKLHPEIENIWKGRLPQPYGEDGIPFTKLTGKIKLFNRARVDQDHHQPSRKFQATAMQTSYFAYL